jgi:hypothetical protein
MTEQPSGDEVAPRPEIPPLKLKTLLGVSLWGASTTLIAWLLAFGSIVRFVIWMLVIGVVVRIAAHNVLKRRGAHPPPWWKM